MASRAPLRNSLCLLGFLLGLYSCYAPDSGTLASIPSVSVSADVSGWQHRGGELLFNNHPFSGYQFQCTPAGDTVFLGTYLNGRAEGIHSQWYASGQLKEERHYQNNWQEGKQRGWHESGKPAFVYQFRHDVYEGSRKEWYANGQPALDGTYHEGREAGPQRQWFADGNLKVNYEARNGRNYGFTGVKNCVNVGDSIAVPH